MGHKPRANRPRLPPDALADARDYIEGVRDEMVDHPSGDWTWSELCVDFDDFFDLETDDPTVFTHCLTGWIRGAAEALGMTEEQFVEHVDAVYPEPKV